MNGETNIVYLCNGIVFHSKRNGLLLHASIWMNLEDTILMKEGRNRRTNAT
jgi:hypothetical protein